MARTSIRTGTLLTNFKVVEARPLQVLNHEGVAGAGVETEVRLQLHQVVALGLVVLVGALEASFIHFVLILVADGVVEVGQQVSGADRGDCTRMNVPWPRGLAVSVSHGSNTSDEKASTRSTWRRRASPVCEPALPSTACLTSAADM
jgi:hypothetical protein